ncbi:MAG: SDR family oxidoreductase [Deltaproteobacteria bacterium]|nr:SDR family oxidoreductase [Deltaproteobacteria bacterium]
MDLCNRVAIVTGAVGTIGQGICRSLRLQGMQLVVADLSQEACDRLAEELRASGGSALGLAVDVTSRVSTQKMAQTVIEAFGQIDVLVNNAGIIVVAPVTDLKESDWDQVIAVNLKGAFLCTQAVAAHMIENRNGRIINISSVAAKRPGPLQTAYAASKHGLIGLTQVWCQELGPHNITVNAVCPGFIDSAMWREQLSPAYAPGFGCEPSELVETIAKAFMPLQRPQTPEDIGQAVAYLCAADQVSGQALTVDGGHALW